MNTNIIMKKIPAIALLALTMMTGVTVSAREVSPEQARRAVGNWLQREKNPLGTKLGQRVRNSTEYRDAAGAPLFHVVALEGGGFVVTAADDEVAPIIAFTDSGTFVADDGNPLWALLQHDLPRRKNSVHEKKLGLINSGTTRQKNPPRQRHLNRPAPSAPAEQWLYLAADSESLPATTHLNSTPADMRVAPLVLSKWNQSKDGDNKDYVYDYYTPDHYPSGCTATAIAQVMRFFAWPTGSVTPATCTIVFNNVSEQRTMLGGYYNWAQMPYETNKNTTVTQRQAIGKLLYDVGLTVGMNYFKEWNAKEQRYEYAGSADSMFAPDALKQRFGYASAAAATCRTARPPVTTWNGPFITPGRDYFGEEYMEDAMLANFDIGAPVIIGVPGHTVVGDGYGYDGGRLFVHLNMGWGGSSDAWYNLPDIDGGIDVHTADTLVFNISPQGTGEIISGRVIVNGSATAGMTVTVSGGGTRTATTNAKGIYAVRVPANGSYTVSASAGGATASLPMTTGSSGYTTVGNRWGCDLRLTFTPSLMVTGSDRRSLTAAYQMLSVSVTSNVAWSVKSDVTWLTPLPVNGTGSGAFSVTANSNTGASERQGVLTISGGGIERKITVTQAGVPLYAAMNTGSGRVWTTGGNANWYGQTNVTVGGDASAARSGGIGHNQKTWLQTTAVGPCLVSFWWKVSSESGRDTLTFYYDNSPQQPIISGDHDWEQKAWWALPSGTHTLRWEYAKNGSGTAGSDAAWVARFVVKSTTLTVTPERPAVTANAFTQTLSVGSNVGWTVQNSAPSWLSLSRTSGENNGTLTVSGAANYATAMRTGTLTFSGGGAEKKVIVQQPAGWHAASLAGGYVNLTTPLTAAAGDVLANGASVFYLWYNARGVLVQSSTAKTYHVTYPGQYTVKMSYKLANGVQKTVDGSTTIVQFFTPPVFTNNGALTVTQLTSSITDAAQKKTSVVRGEVLKLTASIAPPTTAAAQHGPFNYIWYKNGVVFERHSETMATSSVVTTSAFGAVADTYKCVVETVARGNGQPLASATSAAFTPVILAPPANAAAPLAASSAPLMLAPLTLAAGDILTISGTIPQKFVILSEILHTTGLYRYEWRDATTATFHDIADGDPGEYILHFTTADGGVYELTVSGTARSGTFELRR